MNLTLKEKITQNRFNIFVLINRMINKIHFEINKLINYVAVKKLTKDNNKYFLEKDWNTAFENLKNDGICKLPLKINIPKKYQQVKNLHDENIFDEFINPKEKLLGPNIYGQCSTDLNINSEIFKNIFTKNTFNIISKYYKKNFWIRNAPCLITDIKKNRERDYDQGFYHLDHCERQLTLIILLNNTNAKSSHTAFINKTHQKSWFFQNHNRFSKNFIKKSQGYADKNIVSKVIGNAGDVFLFDAGNGLHKAVYGEDRAMIHLIFSQMRYYAEYDKNYENIKRSQDLKHYEVLIDDKFSMHLKQNLWNFKNFKYTSNKF